MSINKTIKYNNIDLNIKFSLNELNGQVGYQQQINNEVTNTFQEIINPIVDGEVRRFKYTSSNVAVSLEYYFYSGSTTPQYNTSFTYAGFNNSELSTITANVLNSFFILDFYDTYDTYTQTKVFSSYLTKINNIPKYRIYNDTSNQFYYLHIPQSYINAQTSSIVYGYVKYSFFNSKTGNIKLFYNYDNRNLTTPEKMYFKIKLDLINNTWTFDTTSFPIIKAYELPSTSIYVTKVNNTIDKFDNKKQIYPTGTLFDKTDGTYDIE